MKHAKSKVYMAGLRTKIGRSLLDKVWELTRRLEFKGRFADGDIVAVKVHFGEKGNLSYIRPNFARVVADALKQCGSKPFVTDCNTLYRGTRSDAPSHLVTALENGFGFEVTGMPAVIGDGLRGMSVRKVAVNLGEFTSVSIGAEIADADGLVVMTHFKCHELTGFGGTLKNLGMGCASREGKLAQHSNTQPSVKPKACIGCAACAKHCNHSAIDMIDDKAVIDPKRCVGCAECILICPKGAIAINWNEQVPVLQRKMVEYAYGAVKGKERKAVYINFVTQISPACDCYGHNDHPVAPDVGILASDDPVALDQASVDLVNKLQGFAGTELKTGHEPGGDKFRGVYPEIDWTVQMEYAEKIGLGSRHYEILSID